MVKTTIGYSFLLSLLLAEAAQAVGVARTYIVQMNHAAGTTSKHRLARRQSSLEAVSVDPNKAMLYNYNNILDGYAARLTQDQAAALLAQPDILSVRLDSVKQLHTTHSPEFLGIEDATLLQQRGLANVNPMTYLAARQNEGSAEEGNIIVGVLDTGAYPESESYNDAGMPAPPARWAGICEEGEEWTTANCNNKLIGARAFYKGLEAAYAATNETYDWTQDFKSARDAEGHGTHTSTTVAGAAVPDVSLYGNAAGTARGMAPGARIAIYKVCFVNEGCYDSDILAAMDTAVADGVHIISMSLGGGPSLGSETDSITTGSYGATARGVLVSASAGNSGPDMGSVSNNAPWMLTVGASSMDRDFPASVALGDGTNFAGASLFTNTSVTDIDLVATNTLTSFVAAADVVIAGGNVTEANQCLEGTLDPALVAGKVVLCERGGNGRAAKGGVVKLAGGLGMVLVNDEASGEGLIADAHMLPAVQVPHSAAAPLRDYLAAAGAEATVLLAFEGTVLGVPAPKMASFSSRGPNLPAPDIMKPDITGPGVNVLAAWAMTSPTGDANDTRTVPYLIISGTSMSCPHLSGMAAWLMARRPDWTVAQIKSALMTTSYTTLKDSDETMVDEAINAPANVYDYGNGHVHPTASLNPGLLYDIQPVDYLNFLCAFNYTDEQIQTISRDGFTCDREVEHSVYDLNYPSFSVWYNTNTTTGDKGDKTVTFHRNVTNVGDASTYTVSVAVNEPEKAQVKVEPETLTFGAAGESQTYSVTVTLTDPKFASSDLYLTSSARLTWTDGTHTVGSSMGFFWGISDYVG